MNKAKDCIDCESRGSGLVQNFAWIYWLNCFICVKNVKQKGEHLGE